VILLFVAYYGAHNRPLDWGNWEGKTPPQLVSPMSMGPTDDHFHYSALFFVSLCYMAYVLAKESDWMTHRRDIISNEEPDPVTRGSIGSFVLYLVCLRPFTITKSTHMNQIGLNSGVYPSQMVHFCITLIYGLPLLGVVYLMRQFEAGAGFTFFYGNTMAIMVGVMALFVERRHPFPTEPMLPPPFAYEVSQLIPCVVYCS
jgi:hypothetical protein